ncbi:N-glycosylase/DNA lyase [Lethenteron reissneri]|uniref:N-glycosylase/DNA lyase n=1 Tax=Lethenteron reissneri TaxID=7753 RepID=UPI002AB7EAB2|nr:N-glycosylase/DNA lyase [Lethenteron reissneri]
MSGVAMGMRAWRSLPCRQAELRLDITLACGQAFRWRQQESGGLWRCVLGRRLYELSQRGDLLLYRVLPPGQPATHVEETEHGGKRRKTAGKLTPEQEPGSQPCHANKRKSKRGGGKTPNVNGTGDIIGGSNNVVEDGGDEEGSGAALRDYLQLGVALEQLYEEWSRVDPHFARVAGHFPGVRVLRQDPVECLFSFICTSNNHISRITVMLERLCASLGELVSTQDGVAYHAFPSLQALSGDGVEEQLRELGFGYRAGFVAKSARAVLHRGGAPWLTSLRTAPLAEARAQLVQLPGVGAKVADCVCLMSLDKPHAVPVDTHVWQIAQRDYHTTLGSGRKSLTDKTYVAVADFFRELWGPYAGWAQSVLFSADLPKFKSYKSEEAKKTGKSC